MIKRIGIFGGTFDPPHIAHSIAAQCVCTELSLEKMIFIPSGNHPLKESLPAHHRLEMAKLAFSGNEKFEVSDIEIVSDDKKTYTIDTLEKLKNIDSEVNYFLIIGTDNLLTLDKWKQPERLFELSEVVVINRPGFEMKKADPAFLTKVRFVNIPQMEISSSSIRKMISENKPIKYFVNSKVEKYIINYSLYKK